MKKFDLVIGFAPEIHVSYLCYGDIKMRDTFVYEYTPAGTSRGGALMF